MILTLKQKLSYTLPLYDSAYVEPSFKKDEELKTLETLSNFLELTNTEKKLVRFKLHGTNIEMAIKFALELTEYQCHIEKDNSGCLDIFNIYIYN